MEEISFSTIIDMPQCKFINEEVIVVNIKCGTYDEVLKEDNFDLIGRYFHTDFYNIDNSGIELHLQSAIGCRVIVNNKGEWQELRREIEDNPKIKEFEIIDVIRIGHIPFYEIVDVDLEGIRPSNP